MLESVIELTASKSVSILCMCLYGKGGGVVLKSLQRKGQKASWAELQPACLEIGRTAMFSMWLEGQRATDTRHFLVPPPFLPLYLRAVLSCTTGGRWHRLTLVDRWEPGRESGHKRQDWEYILVVLQLRSGSWSGAPLSFSCMRCDVTAWQWGQHVYWSHSGQS